MQVLLAICMVSAWVLLALITAGFMNAYSRHRWPILHETREFNIGNMQTTLVICLPVAPVMFVVGFFSCEFYRHGWSMSLSPVVDLDRERRELAYHQVLREVLWDPE